MSNAEEGDGDCALWCSVIKLAISDAVSADKSLVEARQEARAWFEDDGEDFREVCTLAGFEPDRVRTEALKQIAEHDQRHALRTLRAVDAAPRKSRGRQPGTNGEVNKYLFDGEELTVRQWAERTGIASTVLYTRLNNGWSVERAVTTPTGPSTRKSQSALTVAA